MVRVWGTVYRVQLSVSMSVTCTSDLRYSIQRKFIHETAADKLQLGRREAAQAFTRTRRLCLRWPRPSPLSA